jgi:hypothetical protein
MLGDEYAASVDYSETFRLILADFFYSVDTPSTNPRIMVSERILCWKHGTTLELNDQEARAVYEIMDHVFWSTAAVISDNALQSTPGYRYQPTDCFYHYNPADATLVVFTPSNDLSPIQPVYPLVAAATVCADTLPFQIKVALALERLKPLN